MSGYLDLAKRRRACAGKLRFQPASEAVTDAQAVRRDRPILLSTDGRKLESAGFKPKERCGRIIWQKPDTGFWVSQEMALHLLESKSMEGDHKACTKAVQ